MDGQHDKEMMVDKDAKSFGENEHQAFRSLEVVSVDAPSDRLGPSRTLATEETENGLVLHTSKPNQFLRSNGGALIGTEAENSLIENKLFEGQTMAENDPENKTALLGNEPTMAKYKKEHDKIGTGVKKDENNDEKTKEEVVPSMALFRFADNWDRLLMVFGSLCAVIHGLGLPIFILLLGDTIDAFVDDTKNKYLLSNFSSNKTELDKKLPPGNLLTIMQKLALSYVGLGLAILVFAYGQVAFWVLAAERQCHKMRKVFFNAIIHQDIGWFDQQQIGELNSRLSDDVSKIQTGIGDKLGTAIQWAAVGIASFVIGFIKGWKLSLVILSVSPVLAFAAVIMSKVVTDLSSTESTAYAKAGAVAEEVLSAIRTVVAYGGEVVESKRYKGRLQDAFKAGIKKATISGAGLGFTWFVVFASYCLGFWYGAKLVRESSMECLSECKVAVERHQTDWMDVCLCNDAEYTAGVMVIVFFGIIMGAFGLGNSFPSLASFAAARGAAKGIYDIIDRKSLIDSSKDDGEKLPDSEEIGVIKFNDVTFHYPTRPDMEILRGLNLDVGVNERVAIVGPSGCGKSTVIQLIQRLYDAESGMVTIGGKEIIDLNVRWLRSQLGVVGQEPVLFGGSIKENIRYGKVDVTDTDIQSAAVQANAHDFISKLPKKYDTVVGERGAQLSGGQKQRIAIARALVRNPRILLLDEATSALDTESEAVVQAALDAASRGRTTVVIAHRLSTIKNADKIVVLSEGKVTEEGTHDELMSFEDGMYKHMVQAQEITKSDLEETDSMPNSPTIPGSIHETDQPFPMERDGSGLSAKSAKVVAENEEEKLPVVSMTRVMRLNLKETPFIIVGCLASLLNGASQPAFALIFAEILSVFQLPLEKQEKEALFYSLMFLLIGVVMFFTMFSQSFFFGYSGEKLTRRLRKLTFAAMLRQDMAWFDSPNNSLGALTTRLATDASNIQGASGARIGVLLQGMGSLGIGLLLAFIFGWKLTLVILAFVPIIMVAGALQMKIAVGFTEKSKQGLVDSGKVAVECIENIRTVVSLGREPEFYKNYKETLHDPHKKESLAAHVHGITFSFSQSVIFFAYAAAFYFGAIWVDKGEMDFNQVMKVFGCVIFSAMAAGQASSFAPDYAKAKVAANDIFHLLDRKPTIDCTDHSGKTLDKSEGAVKFENTEFHYPTRVDVPVLRGLTLRLDPGKTLALVGPSGCGKSTSIQLLERFYDPTHGEIFIDGQPLKSLTVSSLRKQMGLVSQEPVLFDRTIVENISYGDNSRQIPMDEIVEAAKQANAHDFISHLPMGYDTRAGEKGNQLSGGQKQRVAIARALVRNPKILLLDEATSALDSESEKVVQDALDKASQGRTSIVIAHRLSTIQNADTIIVINQGEVAEQGTHSELIVKKGLYFRLTVAQSLKT